MGFLSTLLYILLGFYALKFLLRLFAPKIMAFAMKRLQKKMNQSFSSQTGFNGSAKEDSATKKQSKQSSKQKETVGEYIDFEEIE